MCAPGPVLPWMMAGLGAISEFAAIQAQNQQARAQTLAALNAAYWDRLSLEEQDRQHQQRFNLQSFERQRQALRERSTLAVAAGDAGVAGNTVLRQIADSVLQEAYDRSIQRSNLANARSHTRALAHRTWANLQGRLSAAQASYVNPFLGALRIGAAGATGYYSTPRGR